MEVTTKSGEIHQKVDAQWKLFCLVHNIEKLARYGAMAGARTGPEGTQKIGE